MKWSHLTYKILFLTVLGSFNCAHSFAVSRSEFHDVVRTFRSKTANLYKSAGLKTPAIFTWFSPAKAGDIYQCSADYKLTGGVNQKHYDSTRPTFNFTFNDYTFDKIGTASLIVTMCHEAGHHLSPSAGVISVFAEGEADYWAASVCLPLFLRELPNPPEEARAATKPLCSDEDASTNINCEKVIFAAEEMFQKFYSFNPKNNPLSKPVLASIINTTPSADPNSDHPNDQCRLLIYVAGVQNKGLPNCAKH